jgi:creatinine amidohydrolase
VRFGELAWQEVRTLAADGAMAVVPTGCTEQQGPHLPVDNDTWFAEALRVEVAARMGADTPVVVLPALPFGPTPEHRGYGSGYVDIPVPVFEEFVAAILASLADQGFDRILVWRGCGGHDLCGVVNAFNESRGPIARAFLPSHPYYRLWCSIADGSVPGGHADSFATSILMAKRPHSVRADLIPTDASEEPDWTDPHLDFTRYSHTGVIGSAAHASPELGERLWDACVDAVTSIVRQIATEPAGVRVERTMGA